MGAPKIVRYAMTIEALRSMASFATALVRSTVNNTEFFCRRVGLNGASSSTVIDFISNCLLRAIFSLRSTDVRYYRSFCRPMPQGIFDHILAAFPLDRPWLEPYSLRMALTAALVKGAEVVCGAIVLRPLLITAASISIPRQVRRQLLFPLDFEVSRCMNVGHDDEQ